MVHLFKITQNIAKLFKVSSVYLIFMVILLFFVGCEKEKQEDFLVQSIDIKAMGEMYLQEFELVKDRPNWKFLEYQYERKSDSTWILIQLSVCNSKTEADSVINVYFSEIAGVYKKGPFRNESAGDKFWWMTFISDDFPSDIIFIRKNVILIFASFKYAELLPLAKKIDYDILHKANYVTYQEK